MFRPKLIAKGGSMTRGSVASGVDVGERLYADAKKVKEHKRQLALRVLEEEKVRRTRTRGLQAGCGWGAPVRARVHVGVRMCRGIIEGAVCVALVSRPRCP